MREFFLISVFILFCLSSQSNQPPLKNKSDRITVYNKNPYYWQYKGKPVMLLGGSWQDNLFNHPVGLSKHLDLLLEVGGNYVRNTMSHRNKGNVFAYARELDGRFNLDRFNDEYWTRFENFLELCYKRDIIVQIEIWDPWDYYEDHQSFGGWSHHPFNPANNISYTAEESCLPDKIEYAPHYEPTEHLFFRTVPSLNHNLPVLKYQQAFIDKLLSITLRYPNILYCINNESGERIEWSNYWANYLHEAAKKAGVIIYVTEMRRNYEVQAADHRQVYDYPERYNFLDISQNTAWTGPGQGHYNNIMYVRDYISDNPRPINNIKNYGSSKQGGYETVARFCRLVFAGCASVRFHRPHPIEDPNQKEASTHFGLGLSPIAQQVIQSMRWIMDEIEFASSKPRTELLLNREENEAYLLAVPGKQYAVYFPKGGEVALDLATEGGNWEIRWRSVLDGTIQTDKPVKGGIPVTLKAPGPGHWVVILKSIK